MAMSCPQLLASNTRGAEEVSKRYRARIPEQVALDIEEGWRGIMRHRAGFRDFGPRQPDIDRAAIRSGAILMRRQHVLPLTDEYMEDDHTGITPTSPEYSMQAFSRELRVVRCALRDEAVERKKSDQMKQEVVIAHGCGVGRRDAETFVARSNDFQMLGRQSFHS